MLRDGGLDLRAEGSRRRLQVPNTPKLMPWALRVNPSEIDPSELVNANFTSFTGHMWNTGYYPSVPDKKDITVLTEFVCPSDLTPSNRVPQGSAFGYTCHTGSTNSIGTSADDLVCHAVGIRSAKTAWMFTRNNRGVALQPYESVFAPGNVRHVFRCSGGNNLLSVFTGQTSLNTGTVDSSMQYVRGNPLYVFVDEILPIIDFIIYETSLTEEQIWAYVNDGTLPME